MDVECYLRLFCTNATPQPLHIAVLVLLPDWSVTQIVPAPGQGTTFLLEPGQSEGFLARDPLPAGVNEEVRIYKAFASVGTTDFRVLEMPTIDRAAVPKLLQPSPTPETLWTIRTVPVWFHRPRPRSLGARAPRVIRGESPMCALEHI